MKAVVQWTLLSFMCSHWKFKFDLMTSVFITFPILNYLIFFKAGLWHLNNRNLGLFTISVQHQQITMGLFPIIWNIWNEMDISGIQSQQKKSLSVQSTGSRLANNEEFNCDFTIYQKTKDSCSKVEYLWHS